MQEKRDHYLQQAGRVPTIASKARRFSDNGEIRFCLQSIATHMPWVNQVYIVTDGQIPACVKDMPTAIAPLREKLRIVDHREIFRDHEELLPTFNSLAIETFLWRIEGLSEKFVYMNDDIFLCGDVSPEDFFRKKKVLLRGRWLGWNEVEKLSFHSLNNRQGAEFTSFKDKKFFKAIHVAHPMLKSIMSNAYQANQEAFIKNASFRFRNRKQFWPISVHNHTAFEKKLAKRKRDGNDWVHFSVAFCRDAEPEAIRQKLNALSRKDKKLGCLNYSEAVVEKVPNALKKLQRVTAPTFFQRLKSMTHKAS